MNRRVVITGIGPVTSAGNGKTEFWKSLLNKKVKVREYENRKGTDYRYKTEYVVSCAEINSERYPEMNKLRNKASRGSALCVYSSLLSIEDAGIKKENIPSDCSVIIGSGFANSHDAVRFTNLEKVRVKP